MAMENHPVAEAFYALVYNPYGKRASYEWSYPKKWFDFKADGCLLIGDELWDFLGGKGTYQRFIEEINSLGVQYKDIIYKDYLHIEPLKETLEIKLK